MSEVRGERDPSEGFKPSAQTSEVSETSEVYSSD